MKDIEKFPWPASYVALRSKGFFTVTKGSKRIIVGKESPYLWLNDMEWMSPKELKDFKPESDPEQIVDIVPFAFTGAHDWWAFYREPRKKEMPVVLCLHDEDDAVLYAPTFEAAMFREILRWASVEDFASSDDDDAVSLKAARQQLAIWRKVLSEWFQPEWNKYIDKLMTMPFKKYQVGPKPSKFDCNVLITDKEAKLTFRKLVKWDRTDKTFPWQKWSQ